MVTQWTKKTVFQEAEFQWFFSYLTENDRSGVTPSAHTYTGFEIEIKRNQLVHL